MNHKTAKGLKKPWKFDNMSEAQFVNSADTGDILLFNCNAAVAKITRAFTGSHFDHAAMVLKFKSAPHEVFLLEATGNNGVALNKWEYLKPHIGHDKFYNRLIYRKVNFERGNKMAENLETFLDEVIGLKYGIGGNKLLK